MIHGIVLDSSKGPCQGEKKEPAHCHRLKERQ